MLAVDTETKGLIYREGVGTVFMVQWADAYREYVATEDTGWDEFRAALRANTDGILLFANASFDIHHLHASGIVDLLATDYKLHDVQTLARVAVPGRWSYKLEALGDDLLGGDSTVAQRELRDAAKAHKIPWTTREKDYYGLWKLEPALMEKYGKEDVRLTYDLWERIFPRARKADIEVYRMEIAGVAPLLRAAEWEGVLVDMPKLDALERQLVGERDDLRDQLLAGGFTIEALGAVLEPEDEPDDDEFLPAQYGKASSKALLSDLLRLGVPLYRLTPSSGKPIKDRKTGKSKRDPDSGEVVVNPDRLAVNKDALQEFAVTYPIVGDLLEWRNRNKILTTYIGALKQADPRIHTSFNQAEARTSRMSSSKPNVQNLPKPGKDKSKIGVRDVLIPAPGNAILSCDYDSIEVRVLAHMINIPELTDKIAAGFDLYTMTSAVAKHPRLSAEQAIALHYDDYLKDGPNDAIRQKHKMAALLSMYGGGARLLATRLGIPVEEAAQIKNATLDAIPGYRDFDAAIQRAVRTRSFPHIETLLGRRLYVPRDKPYVGLNTVIQGNAAELMKLGLIAAAPVAAELDYRLILVVHDEAVFEGPADLADDAKTGIVAAMESAYPLNPALKVSAGWSTLSYGDAK